MRTSPVAAGCIGGGEPFGDDRMNTVRATLLLVTVFALALTNEHPFADAAARQPGGDTGSYDVGLQVSEAGDSSTWRYTITKTTSKTKDLGHFIVNFANCGDQSPARANIQSASVNGVSWLDQID